MSSDLDHVTHDLNYNIRVIYLYMSQVTKLMTKVEEIFTKHFADHDRRKAMAQLRPIQQRGGHSITFLLGTTN